MCRIGGRLWSKDASFYGVDSEIPPFNIYYSNHFPLSGIETMFGG